MTCSRLMLQQMQRQALETPPATPHAWVGLVIIESNAVHHACRRALLRPRTESRFHCCRCTLVLAEQIA